MYEYHVKLVKQVIDGDTIDVDIDLGFDISLTKRVRLNGIDTPESRTSDEHEKKYGLESKDWLKHKLENAQKIRIQTELPDSTEKYGRILGVLWVNDDTVSVNEQLFQKGFAWKYDGGTKQKDFAELDQRRVAARDATPL